MYGQPFYQEDLITRLGAHCERDLSFVNSQNFSQVMHYAFVCFSVLCRSVDGYLHRGLGEGNGPHLCSVTPFGWKWQGPDSLHKRKMYTQVASLNSCDVGLHGGPHEEITLSQRLYSIDNHHCKDLKW